MEVKSRSGGAEPVEVTYTPGWDGRRSCELRLKWLSNGVVIDDLKATLTRTARRLGGVTVFPVPTVSRFPLHGPELDPRLAWPIASPYRCNHLVGSDCERMAALLEECARAGGEGAELPTPLMHAVECALVGELGMLPDMYDAGKSGHRGVGAPRKASAAGEPPAALTLAAMVAHPAWFRQYVHPGTGHLLRIDSQGLLWVPPVAAATPQARDGVRAQWESLASVLTSLLG